MRENKSKTIIYFMLTGMLVLIAGIAAVFSVSSGIRIIRTIMEPYLEKSSNNNIYIEEFDHQEKLYFVDNYYFAEKKYTEPDFNKIEPAQRKLLLSCLVHNKIFTIEKASAFIQYIDKVKHFDPNNGWYDMVQAILLFEDGSPSAINYYYQAFEKPEFKDYSRERLAKKYKLFGEKPTFRNVMRKVVLRFCSNNSSIDCRWHNIDERITDTAKKFIRKNKHDEAEKLLDSYTKFLISWINRLSNTNMYYTMECVQNFQKELPELYRRIHRPDKAKLAADKLSKIIKLHKEASNKCSVMSSSNFKLYIASHEENGYLLRWLFRSFKIEPVMTEARRKIDYIVIEKMVIMLLTVILFLFSVSIFAIFVINFFLSTKKNLSASFDFKSAFLTIAASLALPTALWLLAGSIPAINGKNVNIISNALAFSCQCLLLTTTAITIPWVWSVYFANRTCSEQKHSVYNVNFFVSVKFIILLFIPCIITVIVLESLGVIGNDFLQSGLKMFFPSHGHGLRDLDTPCIWCRFHSRAIFGIFALLLLLVPVEVVSVNIMIYALKRKKHPENTRLLFAMAAPLYAIAAIFFYAVFVPHYERLEAETIIKGDLLNIDREIDMDQVNLQRDTCKKIIEILQK